MELIAEIDFGKVFKGRFKPTYKTVQLLMRFLKINQLNELYDSLIDKTDLQFFEQALLELGVSYTCAAQSTTNIPEKGSFIAISNHPYGGIDGIIMLKTLLEKRPDFKLMGNFLLQKIKPIESYILPVNPFENHPEYASSIVGMRQALMHLKNGGCLGIFPAGEVSTLNIIKQEITDKKWDNSILKFIKMANVPVVPMHFSGSNSKLFHTLGLIHPELRTAKLPSELFNKKDKPISLSIGSPITCEEQLVFSNIEQYGRYLRALTYLPNMANNVKKHFNRTLSAQKKVSAIAPPVDNTFIKAEIKKLTENHLLFNHLSISVYCAPYREMPFIMNEIGRLREITFREVGEGTNLSSDLDEYDLYYWHLFLWDNANEKIVGAYRIGKGVDIFSKYKKQGFYTHSLFKFKNEFNPILSQCLELGRSFIIKEYQRKPMSLFLLWKGILYFLITNPEYRYLIGPVSISNDYSKFSRGLMMKFIEKNYADSRFSNLVKPRTKYKVKANKIGYQILLNAALGDFKKLEKIIGDAEGKKMSVPVLVKKYLQINGRILAFNLDPKFNDSLDGFMLLDLNDIPNDFITSLSIELTNIKTNHPIIFPQHKQIV
jgi:putative hemolysin